MYEYQTILRKGDKTIYSGEEADTAYYIDTLGYEDVGRRTVKDGKVLSETFFPEKTPYRVDMEVDRPIWKDHEIIGTISMSRIDADRYNNMANAKVYYGFTDEEKRLLNKGTADELRAAGFLGEAVFAK